MLRSVRLTVAFVVPLVVLGVVAEQQGEAVIGAVVFVAAIATLVALQALSARR